MMTTKRARILSVALITLVLLLGAFGVSATADVFSNLGGTPVSSAMINWDGLAVDFETTVANVTLTAVSAVVDNQATEDTDFGMSTWQYDPATSQWNEIDRQYFYIPKGMTGLLDWPISPITLATAGTYAVGIDSNKCEGCDSGVSWVTSSTPPSGGNLQYVGSFDATAQAFLADHLFIEITAEVQQTDPDVCTISIPEGSVMGQIVNSAQAYYEPGKASPGVILNPGTYWVIGQDSTESYYKIVLGCQYLWLMKDTMQPSQQPPATGAPLPTRIVG